MVVEGDCKPLRSARGGVDNLARCVTNVCSDCQGAQLSAYTLKGDELGGQSSGANWTMTVGVICDVNLNATRGPNEDVHVGVLLRCEVWVYIRV